MRAPSKRLSLIDPHWDIHLVAPLAFWSQNISHCRSHVEGETSWGCYRRPDVFWEIENIPTMTKKQILLASVSSQNGFTTVKKMATEIMRSLSISIQWAAWRASSILPYWAKTASGKVLSCQSYSTQGVYRTFGLCPTQECVFENLNPRVRY